MADAILSQLNTDSNIGIVFPDDPNAIGWDKNKNYAVDYNKNISTIEKVNNKLDLFLKNI
jgi:hypothetical protein